MQAGHTKQMQRSNECLERTRQTYECDLAVGSYAQTLKAHRDPKLVRIIEKFASSLQSACSIADLGSGTGDIVNRLRSKGFDALGFDYSTAMVERAKRTYGDFFYLRDLSGCEQWQGQRFDVLLSISVLLHVEEKNFSQFIENCCSFGKDTCKFLLATKIGTLSQWDYRLGRDKPRLNVSYSPEQLTAELSTHSFHLVRSSSIASSRDTGEELMYIGEYHRGE